MYTPIFWKNHIVEFMHRYSMTQAESPGLVYLKPAPGEIDQQGTPQSAANFNQMDAGILEQALLSNMLFIIANHEKEKLDGIEDGANNYIHPETHPAEMITQDPEHRFVNDSEKVSWNNTLNASKEYSDATYRQATGYVDLKISELIGGAPETLDTIKEVADAIQENETVVEALDAAIGKKANQAEVDTHTGNDTIHITADERSLWNKKLSSDSDTESNTVSFTSGDAVDGNATAWTSVAPLTSGEKHKSIFNKISTMFKNVRYLYKMLGTTDISTIGDGTATGAISELNNNLPSISVAQSLTSGTKIGTITLNGTAYDLYCQTNIDTKNTAGTTNKTGTKMFLAGATSQAANPQTHSNSSCYIGTDNELYSGGKKVAHQEDVDKKAVKSWTQIAYANTSGTITLSNNHKFSEFNEFIITYGYSTQIQATMCIPYAIMQLTSTNTIRDAQNSQYASFTRLSDTTFKLDNSNADWHIRFYGR